jgi:hypothetical protein
VTSPKIQIAALGLIGCLQGGYMVFDGVHKMTTGSYFGGSVGPWHIVSDALGVSLDRMAVVFVVVGAAWLAFTAVLLFSRQVAALGIAASAAVSLFYPLFGTLLSIFALLILLNLHRKGLLGNSKSGSILS